MEPTRRSLRWTAFVAAAAAVLPALAHPASAQLPSASARALGLADNFTAAARGFAAVAWNPAGLAMHDSPGWSLAVFPVRGVGGLDPVTTSDLAEWEDERVPVAVRREWLEEIRAEGGQRGFGGGDLTLVAFSVGRFGAQVGTVARGTMSLSPDAAELLLFGNAGLTGEPREFTGSGSSLDLLAASTAALSYGHPIRTGADPEDRLALGLTLKYTFGHYVLHGEDNGSRLEDDPVEGRLDFPFVHTDSTSEGDSGGGFGLDLGFAWRTGALTLGGSVQNVLSTFEWDESDLSWRPGQAFFDTDSTASDFDARPIETAPEGVAEFVEDLAFEPVVALGLAYDAGPALTLTADLRHHLREGVRLEPQTHLGAGVEYRPLRYLPLRVGAAAVSGGYQVAGGLGVEFGAFRLTAGAARRDTELGTDALGMLAFSLGGS